MSLSSTTLQYAKHTFWQTAYSHTLYRYTGATYTSRHSSNSLTALFTDSYALLQQFLPFSECYMIHQTIFFEGLPDYSCQYLNIPLSVVCLHFCLVIGCCYCHILSLSFNNLANKDHLYLHYLCPVDIYVSCPGTNYHKFSIFFT